MLHWIDFIWLAIGCNAALLGVIHLSIWWRQRHQVMHGAFALLSFSVTASATTEWLAMRAQSAADYAFWFSWTHAAMLPIVAVMVIFVGTLGPSRNWLAVAVIATRVAATIANFLTGDSLGFSEITALRPIPLWGGDSIATPIGVINPWLALGQLSVLLLIAFIVDVIAALRRLPPSSERARKLRIALAVLFFVLAAVGWNLSVMLLGMPLPVMVAPAFLALALIMSHELSGDVLRAAQLAQTLRLTETDLRTSRNELQLAERAAGLGLCRWDLHRRRIWLSDRGARMLGLTSGGDFDVDAVGARIEATDRALLQTALGRAQRNRTDEFSVEFRVHDPAGSSRWLAAHGQFEQDAALDRQIVHGVLFDVTERRSSDEHFRMVFDSSPAAMLLVDADGNILLANAVAASLSGYSIAELVAMPIDALVPDKERDAHRALRVAYHAAASRRQMQRRREVQFKHKDGSLTSVEIALSPVQQHHRLLVIAAITDVSERKAKDREIGLQRDALAHMARVGMLSELSGSLAHELNQPLAAILSNAQASLRFLNREVPDLAEVREGLTQIVASDKRAGEVIRRLRSMLRKDTFDHAPLDLNDVVHDVTGIVRSDLIDRHVVLHEDLAQGLPAVMGDRVQLQQVVLNLVMNASDAMRDGNGERDLTLRTRAAPGGVLLQVEDSGHGIPDADLERIFSPFVTSKRDGLGFGLALCNSLVNAHGGTLHASNNATRGATLHVFLPAAAPPA